MTTAGCYTFVETLTVGDIKALMEAGIPSEKVYLASVPMGAVDHDSTDSGPDTDSTGTGSIEAGEPMSDSWNPTLVAAGLVIYGGEANLREAVEALREEDGDTELVLLASKYAGGWRPEQEDRWG